ncbi:MAG TPA: transglycosylase SLT domain-containing protein, partial [Acidobacteriaceae bacterium]
MRTQAVTGAVAEGMRQQLRASQQMELDAKVFEERKKEGEELSKIDQERIKGSYEAQILYIEALDEQDSRKKIASIDRITELRVKSAEDVARVQKNELQAVFDAQKLLIETHRPELLKAGQTDAQVDEAIRKLREDMVEKQQGFEYKAFDETQKYRLEGWKKANDVIIEDQKRIYESFKSEFDEIFDAFTQKGKTVGQALGDVFKKLFLGEAKNLFSSTMAQSATELAGYGKPEVQFTRGGIISQLFQRGRIPRPPMAPPEEYLAKGLGSAGLVTETPLSTPTEATKMVEPANLFIVGVDAFNKATQDFLLAVQQFAGAGGAGGAGGGGGGLAALGIPAPALAAGWGSAGGGGGRYGSIIQQASAASGVSPQILRAVIGQESGGNPLARSLKGAMGEMQLMPGTARDLGVTNPYDPQQNITGGARYLGQLMQRYPGNLPAALAAYNMGPAGYDRAMRTGRALPRETQTYVQRLMGVLAPQGAADVTAQAAPAFSMDQFAALPTRLSAAAAPDISFG